MGTTNAQIDSKQIHNDARINANSIEAFFAESVILITGATGFLGKALLEKLLRTCPRIITIFILIRPKNSETIEHRLKTLLESNVFERIRQETPDALKKIQAVKGDVTLPNLGLSAEDKNVLSQTVNIVFHSAATVRFDETLKAAVNLNVRGTERILDLCKSMKNLFSLIHISTAYCNADKEEIKESIYTTKIKPSTVIDMCENLDDETLKLFENKLLDGLPNTYTFTKKLAEQLILIKGSDLPITIVRPSIVCASQEEPFPGWVDNIFGITGIMMEVGRGTVRSLVCNPNLIVDLVPVDYVIDTIICVAWYSTTQCSNMLKVYNCTNPNPVSWGQYERFIRKHAIETPSKYVTWYPGVQFTTNKFIHNILSTTLHILPAFLIDSLLRLKGSAPVMLKTTKRVERALRTGEYFATHEWHFHRNNMNNLTKHLQTLKDCDRFNTDLRNFDWETYSRHYMLGIRKYILKDNLESLSKARNRLLILYWMHKFTQVFSILIFLAMIKYVGR